jgi:hypothetical protein
MAKSQLSMRDRITVWLVRLLVLSLVLTLGGFVASNDARRKMAAFATDGHTVIGTITNKYIHSDNRNQVYSLDVSFKTQDGKFHYETTNVGNTIYHGLQVDGPVKVTYVGSNPDWFYVADDAPTDRDVAIFATMFRYGAIGSLLLLIALVISVFLNRAGGTPAGQTASTADPGEASFRPPRPQPRTGFGTRKRI